MDAPLIIPAPHTKLSRSSAWSLGLSITGMFCLGPIAAIPAIVLGHMSLSYIRKAGGNLRGSGCAIAGLLIGYASFMVHTFLLVLLFGCPFFGQIAFQLKCLTTAPTHLFDIALQDSSCRAGDVAFILSHRLRNASVPHKIKIKAPGMIEIRLAATKVMPVDSIRGLLVLPAHLEFRLVHTDNERLVSELEKDPQNFKCPVEYSRMETIETYPGKKPKKMTYFVKRRPEMKGGDIIQAFPARDQFGQCYISLSFNSKGTAMFEQVTRENVGRLLAIIIDGTLYSAPRIQTAIEGGHAQFPGNFSNEESRLISAAIKAKPLPCIVTVTQERQLDQ